MAHPGYLIALATVCISLGCASEPVPQLVPDNVSMVQIITSPDECVGEVISVSGFLTDHGDMLFLSSDHYQLMDIASMIYVRIAYKEEDKVSGSTRYSTGCENDYARLDGTFADLGDGAYALLDVFSIAKPRGLPDLGPLRIGCWRNDDVDPFLENRRKRSD